ncbi:MAG: hypothetical protein D6775_12490, partial [Caldilineae bacterium]
GGTEETIFASLEDVLESYRSRGTMETAITYPDGKVDSTNVEFAIDWVRTEGPFGGDMAMRVSGFDTAAGEGQPEVPSEVAIYAVGTNMLMKLGEEWVTAPREGDEVDQLPAIFSRPDELVTDLQDFKNEGEETVNGIDVVHYSFDQAPFLDMLLGLEQGLDLSAADIRILGDIWVATDGNYVVKFAWSLEGKDVPDTDEEGNEVLTDVSIRWVFELTEVNTLDAITLPEDAPTPGAIEVPGFAPGEFPIPPNTTVEGSFGGMISLQSELSQEEVTAFYDEHLAALGWTKQEGFMPSWTKGDVTINVITAPGDGGGTNIMIMGQ